MLNREEYKGDVNEKGQRHGMGMAAWSNGDFYEGQWKEGFMHGKGKFRFASGDEYEGEVEWGKRSGTGTYWAHTGHVYCGEFRDDCEEGIGKRVWTSGETYNGEWFRGYMQGYGVTTHKSGERYTGWTSLSLREGRGILQKPENKTVFSGRWSKGKRTFGTLHLPDGSGYHGAWSNDKPHGEGTYYTAEPGSMLQGQWSAGVLDNVTINPNTKHPGHKNEPYNYSELLERWWHKYLEPDHPVFDPDWVLRKDEVPEEKVDCLVDGYPAEHPLATDALEYCFAQQSLARAQHKILRDNPVNATTYHVKNIDATHTYLGGFKAISALCSFLELCPNTETLTLPGQRLSPASIRLLVKTSRGHSRLRVIDVTDNVVHHPEGKMLSSLAATNTNIERIVLENTMLNKGVVEQIERRTAVNRKINSNRVISGKVM